MLKCFHPVYFKEKDDQLRASSAVTMVVLFLFKLKRFLCSGCTSDESGEATHIFKCFAEPGLSHSSSRSSFQVTTF